MQVSLEDKMKEEKLNLVQSHNFSSDQVKLNTNSEPQRNPSQSITSNMFNGQGGQNKGEPPKTNNMFLNAQNNSQKK